jgi:hypothetical protein
MAGKSSDPPNPPDDTPGRPGAVVHDASGKAVWKWSSESDSTSRLLKQLEVPGLAIEDEPKPKADEKAAAQQIAGPGAGGGFNPYGDTAGISRSPASRPGVPRQPAQAAPARPTVKQPLEAAKPAAVAKPQAAPRPARRRGWFSRLFGGKD